MSPVALIASYAVLLVWTVVVLFPLYWVAVTSLKLPIQVSQGPLYLPFVDFKPSLHAWRYILFELGSDVRKPYVNTIVVALVSSVLTMALGTTAAYGLARFQYRPRIGAVLSFIGCLILGLLAFAYGAPWQLAVAGALALFFVVLATLGRRFRRALGNEDVAVWIISNRVLPPVAVVLPLYILFQRFHLLDTRTALIVTYTTINLPIAVWLLRDYFRTIPVDLEEAARVDGASRFRIFSSIVLPLSVPGLVATFLLVVVFTWNEYLLALFLSSANAQTMPILVAAQHATRGPQWWYMSVLIMIMILPVIVLAIVLERYIARGILIGAIKG
jgi:multiple sugar transport system permease protein